MPKLLPTLLVTLAGSVPRPALQESEAAALWAEFRNASRGGASESAPIEAFHLRADVLTREVDGVGRNEGTIDFSYLGPDFVRFALPGGGEVGRSGLRQRDYWLESAGDVVVLEGREYGEDRRQVQEMHALAKNFLSLIDPARVEIENPRLLERPPADLPDGLERVARKLEWLRVESPAFALSGTGAAEAGSTEAGDRERAPLTVDLGLVREGKDVSLPRLVVVRPPADRRADPFGAGARVEPMLLRMEEYADLDGFRTPHDIFVHAYETRRGALRFAEMANQEIYLRRPSTLRAGFTPEDFRP